MKFITATTATALLATSSVSARSLFGSSNDNQLSINDESFSVPGDNPLLHCADPKDDILELKSVDLDPNPPKAGETLTVKAKGTLLSDVEEGAKIHLSVKYGLITIIKQTADLCDTVQQVDLECPLKKDNETTLTKEVELPRQIPPGKYTVVADVVSKEDEEGRTRKITCLTATVEFKRNAAGAIDIEYKQGL